MKDLSLVYPKPSNCKSSVRAYEHAKSRVLEQIKTGELIKENLGYNINDSSDLARVYSGTPGHFDVGLSVQNFYDGSIRSSQRLRYDNDLIVKNNYIHRDGQKFCSSVQIQDKASGRYSVSRMKDGKVIGGYEVAPVERKLMTGFKGKVEALAMKIGTNSNGCERPVLRRVSGFMLDMLRKIK